MGPILSSRLTNTYRTILLRRLDSADDLTRSAIVFSPHPDDETLGCGGTIARKKQAGASVKVVIFTDGRKSHKHLIPESELKRIREIEAREATTTLGLENNDLTMLEYEDGVLVKNIEDAIKSVLVLLRNTTPDEVFIPYRWETPGDHWAVNKIVRIALQQYKNEVTVFEYPIWFWANWPFVGFTIKRQRDIPKSICRAVVANYRLVKDFNTFIDIGDVLNIKKLALNKYRSQMTRLTPLEPWMTLGDVCNGRFMDCFLQNQEIYFSYRSRSDQLASNVKRG